MPNITGMGLLTNVPATRTLPYVSQREGTPKGLRNKTIKLGFSYMHSFPQNSFFFLLLSTNNNTEKPMNSFKRFRCAAFKNLPKDFGSIKHRDYTDKFCILSIFMNYDFGRFRRVWSCCWFGIFCLFVFK